MLRCTQRSASTLSRSPYWPLDCLSAELGVERRQRKVAESAKPIVDRYDDIPLSGKPGRLHIRVGAVDPAAAMKPDKHRPLRAGLGGGRIDVERKTILMPTRW